MRKILITVGASVLIIIGLISVINAVTFRLNGTDPHNSAKDTSAYQNIHFKFNHAAADPSSTTNIFTSTPHINGTLEKHNNELVFVPLTFTAINTTYTVKLQHVTSEKGQTLRDISLTFTPSYIAESNQSSEALAKIKSLNDAGGKTDPIREKFINGLPYSTKQFSVDYISQTNSFEVTVYSAPVDTAEAAAASYLAAHSITPRSDAIHYTIAPSAGGAPGP